MWQTITNAIYGVSAGIALSRYRLPMTLAMILLGVSSGMYHGMEWLADGSKFWQRMDVSAIYIVVGLFPYTITRVKGWLWLFVPVVVLIANKFGYLGATWDSNITVPVLAIPTLIVGYMRIKRHFFWDAIALMVVAFGYAMIGNNFDMNLWGYDQPHGMWHILSGSAFCLLLMGSPIRWHREQELNVIGWFSRIGRKS